MPRWHLKDTKGIFYPAEIQQLTLADARSLKQIGWEQEFDWSIYTNNKLLSDPYKLLTVGNAYIQGAIAYHDAEGYVFVDLLESAPTNLVRYYMDRFGAEILYGTNMVIDENGAQRLFQLYYY